MDKTKIKFAIVGCGRIAQRHAEHINNIGILEAVCDIDKNKADDLSVLYHAKSYYNIDELISKEKDIDIVSICSPNGLHAEQSIKALKAGFHVLCEKPMALSVKDCIEMIETAEIASKKLFIVKQNRFNPPVAAVKKLIDENKLGKIFSIQLSCFWNRDENYYNNSWKGTKVFDGGTLYTQFSHFVDLLYWFFGDVEKVYSIGRNAHHIDSIEFEDTGVVAMEFNNGILGTINYNVNSYKKNMEGSLTIFGEKGTVKIGGQYLNELEYQCIDNYEISDLPLGNPANQYGHYQGSMSNHNLVYQNVVDVIMNNFKIATTMQEGMKTVEIIEKIYYSMHKNSKK
jgi:UDP-N-acetyl-2-amino-2-deoxyglucuronate dehydrogenase